MPDRPVPLAALLMVLAWTIAAAHAATAGPFANWAGVVVAGDHEDSDGDSSEGFDSARREVSRDLMKLGFLRGNIAQFSLRPREYASEKLLKTSPNAILRALGKLVRKTNGGCILYLSSHGEPDGLIIGDWVVTPHALAQVVDHTCADRPTVVIISACFSGVMVPALKGLNRMILTAARRDRTSFGCGQSDRFPYFDQCVLQSWSRASSFPDLAGRARACVAAREKSEHLKPASEPQYWIGPQALASLPRWH